MLQRVWIFSFLVFSFTGNFLVVSDHYENDDKSKLIKLDVDSSLSEIRWTARYQGCRIPDIEYVDAESSSEGNFMKRHLLGTTKNGSTKNGSSLPPASLSLGEKIAFNVGYAIMLFFGLFGNILILFVVNSNKELHNNINLLLCNLVVADVLRMLFSVSFELFMVNKMGEAMSPIQADPGPSGSIFCKAMFALPQTFTFAFVFTLLAMTVERFVAVVFPFKAIFFKNKSKWIILVAWISAVSLEMPGLYAFTSIPYPGGGHICYHDFSPQCDGNYFEDKKCNEVAYKRFLTASTYIPYVITFALILTLHAAMVVVLYKNRARFGPESSCVSKNSTNSMRDVVRMLGVVSILYLITTLPTQIYQFGYIYDRAWVNRDMPVYFNFLLIFIENSHSMFYPWVYPLFVKRFRAEYAKLTRKCVLHKKSRTSSSASTMSGRQTIATNDSITKKLLRNNLNETKF